MSPEIPTPASSKLAVVGAGSVGTAIAYAALIRGSARQVAIYDVNEAKVTAEVADLAHGTQYTPRSRIMGGADIEYVAGASIVIITAGARQDPGQTRMDLASVNAGILRDLMPKLVEQAPKACFVLVTNPCDVLTVVAQKVSGLPTSQVFSTGTMLDTSRLRWAIAEKAKVAQSNVHANIVGEHGDTEFPIWSTATISQIPIREWTNPRGQRVFTDNVLDEVAENTVNAAYSIIAGKGATNYAIGLTGARLTEAVLEHQRMILPLSSVLTDYRGVSGVALSVPSMVSKKGIQRVYEVPMDDGEQQLFRESADHVGSICRSLGY